MPRTRVAFNRSLPRVLTLPISDLSMLVRFALLTQLHDEAGAAPAAHHLTTAACRSYGNVRMIEGLEYWWPLLMHFADDWLLQRQTS